MEDKASFQTSITENDETNQSSWGLQTPPTHKDLISHLLFQEAAHRKQPHDLSSKRQRTVAQHHDPYELPFRLTSKTAMLRQHCCRKQNAPTAN
jgi:hypothetical protein